MMSDRELLELAAKAAGFAWVDGHVSTGLRDRDGRVWNPLTNDGDALRLAVRLCLLITQTKYEPGVNAYGSVGIAWYGQKHDFDHEHFTDDPYAATRRAIVRAAAEIGRKMS
jgi:prepilin-type processing-associated H-X9-DG protein